MVLGLLRDGILVFVGMLLKEIFGDDLDINIKFGFIR